MITFKIKANEELFERWSDLTNIFEHEQFQAIIQNDMEITNEQLIEWMNRVRSAEKVFSEELHELFMDTIKYIKRQKHLISLPKPKKEVNDV